MARKDRVLREGMMYHVMSRGNERQKIFTTKGDREMFLGVLSEGLKRYEGICHSWCLMGNHYHLMIETLLPNLSELMRWVGTTYTMRYNRKRGRVGHLFQGRYRAEVVDSEQYTKRLILYIHMNPVRRKKGEKKGVKNYVGGWEELEKYEWSSHHGYAGKKVELKPGFDLGRRKYWRNGGDYRREVEWELVNRANLDLREEARMGLVLGGDDFSMTLESHLAHEGEKARGISRGLELFRRRERVMEVLKKEKEKKWRIWIQHEYGKESKAGLAREYGYKTSSGIQTVLKQIQKKLHEGDEVTLKKVKAYEKIRNT